MASTRDSIADIRGPRTPSAPGQWPVRMDGNLEADPDRGASASCYLCADGCGLEVGVKDDRLGGRIVGVRGRAPDTVNRGRLGVAEGDMLRLLSRRGVAEAPARIGDIEPGTLFMPFHYGCWGAPGRNRAANELTLYEWDPVSKQPHFKCDAAKPEKASGAARPTEEPR